MLHSLTVASLRQDQCMPHYLLLYAICIQFILCSNILTFVTYGQGPVPRCPDKRHLSVLSTVPCAVAGNIMSRSVHSPIML